MEREARAGWRLFLWQLGFTLAVLVGMVVLRGNSGGLAFALGWFTAPREHMLGLVLGGIVVFFVFLFSSWLAAVVHVLTKDFVVPQMALEGIGAVEGWRRLWPMIQAEKGGYAGYVGMKIVLAIGAGIVIGIVSVILAVVVAIPAVGLGNCGGAHGENRWTDMECTYHHRGGGGGMCAVGGFVLFDGADRGAGDCVLSGVFDLFLCGAVPGAGPGVVSRSACGDRWASASASGGVEHPHKSLHFGRNEKSGVRGVGGKAGYSVTVALAPAALGITTSRELHRPTGCLMLKTRACAEKREFLMSFAMAGGGARGPQINVTPLIDVLLTLIIMFMLVVSMDKEYQEKAQIPQPDKKADAAETQSHTIVIQVV